MIEQTQQCLKVRKSSKKPKKPEQKIIEEEPQFIQKIQEEGKEISEMSEPNQQEERKRAAINLYELLEDLIAYLLLDHDQFKQQIQESLNTFKNFDLSKINFAQINAFSFLGKVSFVEKKLAESQIEFDRNIVAKQKEVILKIIKKGVRSYDYLGQYYKDYKPKN